MQQACHWCRSDKIIVDDYQSVCEGCGAIVEGQVTSIVPFTGHSDEHGPNDSRVFIPLASRYECECVTATTNSANGSSKKIRLDSGEVPTGSHDSKASQRVLSRKSARKRVTSTEQEVEALINTCIKQLHLGDQVRQLAVTYFRQLRCHPAVSNTVGELQAVYAIACVSCASRAVKTPVTFASLRSFLETAKQVRSFKRIIEKTKQLLWTSGGDTDGASNSGTISEQSNESPFALKSSDLLESLVDRAQLEKPARDRAQEIWSLVQRASSHRFSPELTSVISVYLAQMEATATSSEMQTATSTEEQLSRKPKALFPFCSVANLCRFSSDRLGFALSSSQLRSCFMQLTDRLFSAARTHLPNLLPVNVNDDLCMAKAEFTRQLHLHLRDLSAFSSILFDDARSGDDDEDSIKYCTQWSALPHRSVLDPVENEHDVPITQFDSELDGYILRPSDSSSSDSEESTSEDDR